MTSEGIRRAMEGAGKHPPLDARERKRASTITQQLAHDYGI